ncbi:hypothetical protein OF83DRAFT_694845 [Amylostereum chailletii]|nr:hypothetical protein OF83DRAFT_694845 [Amylostereum chailletii]
MAPPLTRPPAPRLTLVGVRALAPGHTHNQRLYKTPAPDPSAFPRPFALLAFRSFPRLSFLLSASLLALFRPAQRSSSPFLPFGLLHQAPPRCARQNPRSLPFPTSSRRRPPGPAQSARLRLCAATDPRRPSRPIHRAIHRNSSGTTSSRPWTTVSPTRPAGRRPPPPPTPQHRPPPPPPRPRPRPHPRPIPAASSPLISTTRFTRCATDASACGGWRRASASTCAPKHLPAPPRVQPTLTSPHPRLLPPLPPFFDPALSSLDPALSSLDPRPPVDRGAPGNPHSSHSIPSQQFVAIAHRSPYSHTHTTPPDQPLSP